jgi:hypothetical protein
MRFTVFLQVATQLTLCYSELDGNPTDTSWSDSYVHVHMSKTTGISAHSVTHYTFGHIAAVTTLQLLSAGTVDFNSWLSLVDQTLNANTPCTLGSVAAASADGQHSGAVQAGSVDKVVEVNTRNLDTTKTFSVCYSETGGYSNWADSGIRVSMSTVAVIQYGLPTRNMYSYNVIEATNRLPQVAGTVVTYVGDLGTAKWMSLVDSTLNSNNPCVEGSVAAAGADSIHSESIQGAAGTKEVTIPQSTLLSETKTFAICYADADGTTADSTWRDSYVRVMISKMRSLAAHSVTHLTDGHIPSLGSLVLTFTGTLSSTSFTSLVDSTLASSFPCFASSHAASEPDISHSGPYQAIANSLVMDTVILSTAKSYAVCFVETGGTISDTWTDSGIRLSVSALMSVEFYQPIRASTGRFTATNVIPQSTNIAMTYVGDLGTAKWMSLVDSTLTATILV